MAFEVSRKPKAGSHPSQEIHIAPLGWEFDRIVQPFLPQGENPPVYKLHRLVLVVPGLEGAGEFPNKIRDALVGICEVEIFPVNRSEGGSHEDLDYVAGGIANVLARELHEGNKVHVNISGAGKLDAFAAGLATMAYVREETGGLYYVKPKRYAKDNDEQSKRGIGVGFDSVVEIPPLPLGAPKPFRIWALKFIAEQSGPIDQLELLKFMVGVPESPLASVDLTAIQPPGQSPENPKDRENRKKEESRARMMLKRSVVDPLHDEGYVRIIQIGRKRSLELTRKGRLYADLAQPLEQMG